MVMSVACSRRVSYEMHGLIFETSIWLLAGSTRYLRWPAPLVTRGQRPTPSNRCCSPIGWSGHLGHHGDSLTLVFGFSLGILSGFTLGYGLDIWRMHVALPWLVWSSLVRMTYFGGLSLVFGIAQVALFLAGDLCIGGLHVILTWFSWGNLTLTCYLCPKMVLRCSKMVVENKSPVIDSFK